MAKPGGWRCDGGQAPNGPNKPLPSSALWGFCAARADEASLGLAKFGHGAFTQALLEALVGTADLNRDGDITYAELRDFVVRRVVELTDDRQHPQLPFLERDFEPDAVFARAYYANQR